MSKENPLLVVVGVLFNAQEQILVALRPADKVQGGLWEFPGGKIEFGETPEEALYRELFEEVGVQVTSSQPLIRCEHHYKEHYIHLEAFEVRGFTGTAHGKEGQIIEWIAPQKLLEIPLLSANRPIVEAILHNT